MRPVFARIIGTVAMAGLTAGAVIASSDAIAGPDVPKPHYISGVQIVTASPHALMACADRHLNDVRPGGPVRLTVRLGSATATLTGTAHGKERGIGSDAIVRHAEVVVNSTDGSTRYRVPDYLGPSSLPEVSVVGSRAVHGYLCLERFQSDQPAAGLVGVDPVFMGEAPRLALLAAGAKKAQYVEADFRRWDVVSADDVAVVRTGDMRFYGIGEADADSGFPLGFFAVTHTRLHRTSSHHPEAIRRDAALWWHRFAHPKDGPRLGSIAAWAADECTLGHQATAFARLDRLEAKGRLHVAKGIIPKAKRHFNRYLERFLRKTGYAT